jgi:endonuclease YncB( thermonuclease family)
MTATKRSDLYIYSAEVLRCVDGDTVEFLADLGFSTFVFINGRLKNINAPEKNRIAFREAGIAAKLHLEALLDLGPVLIQTSKPKPGGDFKKGKFGRWIVEILVETDEGYLNINDRMVEDGHAVFQKY